MKPISLLGLLLPLAAAKVSYDGYKAFRIETGDDHDAIETSLADLEFVSLSCESNHQTLEVAIAPDSIEAFEALKLKTTVLSEDIGEDIALEGPLGTYERKSNDHDDGETRMFC